MPEPVAPSQAAAKPGQLYEQQSSALTEKTAAARLGAFTAAPITAVAIGAFIQWGWTDILCTAATCRPIPELALLVLAGIVGGAASTVMAYLKRDRKDT